MKTVVFSFIFLMVIPLAFAQLRIEKQAEFMLSGTQQRFEVINLGKNGALLCVENLANQSSLTISKYDTALQQVWQQEYPINFKLMEQLRAVNESHIHFLANSQDSVYQIITIDLRNGNAEVIDCINPLDIYTKKFRITHFASVGDAFLFGGQNDQERPAVLYYHLHHKEFKVLPNINFLKSKLIEITSNESVKMFSVLLASKGNFYYHVYDEDGKLLGNNEVKPDNYDTKYKNYFFNSFKTHFKNDKEQLVIGIYSTSILALHPQGIYVTSFINYKHQNTQFYSFNQFQNFHNHLDSLKKKKILSKIKTKGYYKYDYDVELQNMQEVDRQILLTIKVSKPQYTNSEPANAKKHPILRNGRFEKTQEVYTTPPPVTNNENNSSRRVRTTETTNPIPNEPSAFASQKNNLYSKQPPIVLQQKIKPAYIHLNIVTCVLDSTGKMLWDNASNASNLNLPVEITELATGLKQGQTSILHCLNNKLLFFKTHKALPNTSVYLINSPFQDIGDLLSNQKVINWYENHFLLWGAVLEKTTYTNKPLLKLKIIKINTDSPQE